MSSALPGSMDRGECVGRDESSTSADSPSVRKRPSHLRAVAGVTPCSAAACVKLIRSKVHLVSFLQDWGLVISSLSDSVRVNSRYSLLKLHN